MDKNIRNVLYGFTAWLVPFVVSFLFYSPKGEPLYDAQIVHNVLIVLGLGLCSYLLIKYFEGIKKDYAKEGLVAGVTWFLISVILDMFFIVFMFGMPLVTWAGQIGIGYLAFPILGASMGIVLNCKLKK